MKDNKLIIFFPSIEGGGVEKNFFIISNYLAKKYKNIHLISSPKNKIPIHPKVKIIGVKNNFIFPNSRIIKIFISMLYLIKEIIFDRKVLVLSFQANLYAILICKIFHTKIIIRSNSSPTGWTKSIIKKNIFKWFLKYPKAIIVNSVDFKNEMKKKFNIESKCILNPLDKKNILRNSKKKIKKKIYKKKKSLKLICIGRLVDQKDHLTLLKAINLIHLRINVELLIVGRGQNKSQIKDFINQNKLDESITLIDFKPNPYPYIKLSNALILSSKYEGLPNVLLEALTLGKPIISSDCPTGPREILSNGKGGLMFNVGDYKSLSKKIIFLKKNYKYCLKKTKYAMSRLDRYDERENLNRYFKLISNIK
jgi:glycosyltransferase involved in cell wall biosynthesis